MKYDAILIGSGLGCLATAGFLVRHGKRVLLLERHDVPGGFTHTFKRKGYEWDVGVHYVGQVSDPKSLMRRVFDYLSDGELQWAEMDEVYDRVQLGSRHFDFVRGKEALIKALIAEFPTEEKAIRTYFKRIAALGLASALFFGERSMPKWLSVIFGPFMRWKMARASRRTTYEVLREITDNEDLIQLLCSQCGDYGLPPQQSSFGVHAGLVNHYLEGGAYPVGGARAIYETLLKGIRSRGGELRLSCEVKRVLSENGRAVGVELSDGEKIFADQVISGAGARNTFTHLWPEQTALPDAIARGLNDIRPSIAHVCLYVGLKASDQELGLPKNNFWLYDDGNLNKEFSATVDFRPGLAYISFPSAKDPAWAAKYPGRATVQIIAPCPYEWVKAWREKPWMKRGSEYMAIKNGFREALLEKLYEVAPQTRGHVDYCEVSTPLSTAHFSGYASGEIYGLEHTPKRMAARWLRAHSPLKGLFLTGQDVIMVGVGGALFSGVVTSVAALRRNVISPVLRYSTPTAGAPPLPPPGVM